MHTVDQADVTGKRVLVRVDFNVPLDAGTVTDDTRIRAVLPTINYLLEHGARVILMSHLGRPQGTGFEQRFSLAPVARVLARILGREVAMAPDCVGSQTQALAQDLKDGEVLMLENLRFDNREKLNDPEFSSQLAALAEIYVNDAFGTAHRSHSSVTGVAGILPCYAGFLLAGEVKTLSGMLKEPKRPFVAILGGSKVSDKIKVIDSLLDTVDALLIGGGMCFTFLAAQGYSIGKSLREEDWIDRAAVTLQKAAEKGVKLLLPVDVVVAEALDANVVTSICDVSEIPDDKMGLDIGPVSCELFTREIASARTVFWNGPMGVFELKPFENGTKQVAKAVARNKNATTVIGGGDSVAAIRKFDLVDQVSFISTGGGASMQFVEGTPLPGIVALD